MATNGKHPGSNSYPNPEFDPSVGCNIYGTTFSDNYSSIYDIGIGVSRSHDTGWYSLDSIKHNDPVASVTDFVSLQYYVTPKYYYRTLDSTTYCHGQLNITKWVHTADGFVSGTFWFDIYNPKVGPDTVHVTEGRFDIGR